MFQSCKPWQLFFCVYSPIFWLLFIRNGFSTSCQSNSKILMPRPAYTVYWYSSYATYTILALLVMAITKYFSRYNFTWIVQWNSRFKRHRLYFCLFLLSRNVTLLSLSRIVTITVKPFFQSADSCIYICKL